MKKYIVLISICFCAFNFLNAQTSGVNYMPPQNFAYQFLSNDIVIFTWNSPMVGSPEYYNIERNDEIIATIPKDEDLTFTDNLEPGQYLYRLFVHFEDGTVIPAENTFEIVFGGEPAIPINFNYIIEDNNNVILTWEKEPESLTPLHYKIDCNGFNIATLSGSIQTYHDIGLSPGSYTYHLYAIYNDDIALTADNPISLDIPADIDENNTPIKKIVQYSTRTETFYAIPSCIDAKSITDLDRVSMISDEPLIEHSQLIVNMDNQLKVIVDYPQMPRYKYDYQYMVGKSVTSAEGIVLYDHEGNKLAQHANEEDNMSFILSDENIETLGIYNDFFYIEPADAVSSLEQIGFQIYEENGVVTGISDNMEITIDFESLTKEIRFFADTQMNLQHQTQYITVNSYIIPFEETQISYSILPSEIPYQITKVKTYLSYSIMGDESEGMIVDVNFDEEGISTTSSGHKSNQGQNQEIDQFDEVKKREMDIRVFPNPATNQITVILPFYMQEDVNINVSNSIGIIVLSQQHINGEQIDLDISSLPSGFYVIRCIKNHKIISTRFVK